MKDPLAVKEALESKMPWGDILHGIKVGLIKPAQLRLLSDAIAEVPDSSSVLVDLAPVRRLVALMSVCFFAKENRYQRGTEGYQSLEAFYGNLAMAILDE